MTYSSDSQFSKTDSDGCGCKMCKENRRLGWIQALMWVISLYDMNFIWKPYKQIRKLIEQKIQNA